MVIDIEKIDLETFNVTEKDGRILVVPKKTKREWSDDELHLRSLLLDKTGKVLSAGFPKFFNFGERPERDKRFLSEFKVGNAKFTRKMDGSLILATNIDGKAHFRTRGNHDLGDFHDEVMAVVESKYPQMLEYLDDPYAGMVTFLFEYVSPKNKIVVTYNEPELYFLGFVDNSDLRVVASNWIKELGTTIFGTPSAPKEILPADFHEAQKVIKSWDDLEGVVAEYEDENYDPVLVKLKSEWYIMVHALKFRLSGRKLRKFAYLTGTHLFWEDFVKELAAYGVDWETAEFLYEDYAAYRAAQDEIDLVWTYLMFNLSAAPRKSRKEFVEWVKNMEQVKQDPFWFSVAMLEYDGKKQEMLILLDALALGESPLTVKQWLKDKDAEISDLIRAPVPEEE